MAPGEKQPPLAAAPRGWHDVSMAHFDQQSAELTVFTFKEGLLSGAGHDLKLRATRFELTEDEQGRLRVRVEPRGIELVAAVRNGREEPGLLSKKDREQIEQHLRDDVLEVGRYGAITFESTEVARGTVRGRLSLHGTTEEITLTVREAGGNREAEVRLDQRRFGIKPFRALLGALKVAPEVLVRVRLPPRATGV